MRDKNNIDLLCDFAQCIFEAREFIDDFLDLVQIFRADLWSSLLRRSGNHSCDAYFGVIISPRWFIVSDHLSDRHQFVVKCITINLVSHLGFKLLDPLG